MEQAGIVAQRNVRELVSVREIAQLRVARCLESSVGDNAGIAELAVGTVLGTLREPDAYMIEAGRRELALALPKEVSARVQRDLVRVMWRAMLAEAQSVVDHEHVLGQMFDALSQ
jgi:hypothetical protein